MSSVKKDVACAGWQHHFTSNSRYHFVLPAVKGPTSLESTDYLPSYVEAKLDGLSVGPPPIASGKHESHSYLYNAPATALDCSTHLLHGVIHLNGFGHLLRINGLEGGSVHLTGTYSVWCGTNLMPVFGGMSFKDIETLAQEGT